MRRRLLPFALVVYVALAGAGFVWLAGYAGAPGEAGDAPASWPADVLPDDLAPAPDSAPTLLLFLHPRCPCSHATMSELSRLLPRLETTPRVAVLFYHPPDTTADWARHALWRRAAALPGAAVHADPGGRVAHRFGAATSGHAVLYAGSGRLRFQGGLTAARGHEGPNDGTHALRTLLGHDAERDAPRLSAPLRTPVFGCPLHGPGTACADGRCPLTR